METSKNKNDLGNKEQNIKECLSDDDGNGNLANNNVDTNIDPDTVGNLVYVSLCSCTISVNCTIS